MRIRIATSLAAAVLAGTTALTACSSSGGGGSDSGPGDVQLSSEPVSTPAETSDSPSTEATSETPSDEPTSEAATSEAPTSAAAGAGTPVRVNKSFSDTLMGDKATVLSYLLYTPSAASVAKFSALEDEQVVLVDVRVTATDKYYTSFGADSFYLTGMSNGIDSSETTILDDEVTKAGYPVLEDAEQGETKTGWVVFTPKKDEKKLILRYKRLAATTSDGKSIPEKNFDIPLN